MSSQLQRAVEKSDVSVLILGAGSGHRMGGKKKAFLRTEDKTFLEQTVQVAASVSNNIFVGLAEVDFKEGQALVGRNARIVVGGATRQETIAILADFVTTPIVVIHDVARPFVTADLFKNVITNLSNCVACVPVCSVPVRDSLCRCIDGFVEQVVKRDNLMTIQTPQAFDAAVLRSLLQSNAKVESSLVTLLCKYNYRVKTVLGETTNIKVTYEQDITLE